MPFGDVMWANLPAPDGPDDHVQAGRRPAVLVADSHDLFVQAADDDAMPHTRTVVPLSKNLKTLRFPATVRIDPSPTNGIKVPSVMLGFALTTLSAQRVGGVCGRLEEEKIAELKAALRAYLQLE